MKKKWISTAIVLCALCVCAACGAAGTTVPVSRPAYAAAVSLSAENGTAEYAALPDGMTTLLFDGTGDREVSEALVLSSVTDDAVFTFGAKLSAARLTQDFDFIEYIVLPMTREAVGNTSPDADFNTFEIRLTDINDRSNYVVFTNVVRSDVNNVTSGRAGAAGQTVVGLMYNTTTPFQTSYGTQLRNSFVGAYDNAVYAGAVSYDNAERAVYAYPTHTGGKALVRDMDDDAHMQTGDMRWNGFTSGELEVSVRFSGIKTGRTARVAILSFNGVPLTSSVADVTAPDVYPADMPETAPVGQVGTPFPVFTYDSYDDIDGLMHGADTVRVYYGRTADPENEYPLTDGAFMPDRPGEYLIRAVKTDSSGNTGYADNIVTVERYLPPLLLTTESEPPQEITVGERLVCPSGYVTGGTSGKGYTLSVRKDGTEVETENDAFTVAEQGVYTLRYTLYDYLGARETVDYVVRALPGDSPIVSFPFMPSVSPVGAVVEIPDFEAVDWCSYGVPVAADITAELTSPSGEETVLSGRTFTPQEPGMYTLTLVAAAVADPSLRLERTYEIEVIAADEVTDYFLLDGVAAQSADGFIVFASEGDGGGIRFVNPLPLDTFRLRFLIPQGYSGFSALNVTLTDSLSPKKSVTVRLYPTGDYSGAADLCGETYRLNSSFLPSMPFSLTVQNDALYNLNVRVGAVSSYDDGAAFDGFPSGKVYLRMAFEGVEGTSGIRLEELSNHTNFLEGATDNSGPMILPAGALPSRAVLGGVVTTPEVAAYDVFSGSLTVTAAVYYGNDCIVQSTGGALTFVPEEYGIYVLRMTAVDGSGNPVTVSHNIYVDDNTPPTITMHGEVPVSGSVGSRIALPSASGSAADGTALEVRVFVKIPGGSFEAADNGFTPETAGKYTVYYYAYDADFNPCILTFVITIQ